MTPCSLLCGYHFELLEKKGFFRSFIREFVNCWKRCRSWFIKIMGFNGKINGLYMIVSKIYESEMEKNLGLGWVDISLTYFICDCLDVSSFCSLFTNIDERCFDKSLETVNFRFLKQIRISLHVSFIFHIQKWILGWQLFNHWALKRMGTLGGGLNLLNSWLLTKYSAD